MTTEAEAMRAAAEIYGRILADPERREQLRAARAAHAREAADQSAQNVGPQVYEETE